MKNNKGFSLMELIVVIAILGVVIGYIGVRANVIFGYSAKEARTKIYSSLENLRVSALSKSRSSADTIKSGGGLNPELDIYIEIYQEGNGIYYVSYHEDGLDDVVNKLGPKSILIQYELKDGTTHLVGNKGDGLFLAYNRSTGGFIPQGTGATNTVNKIITSSADKTYVLDLMPSTGKVLYGE